MRAITRKSRAAVAAARWAGIYRNDDLWIPGERTFCSRTTGEIRKALEALGSNPDPDDVDAVIGNNMWTFVPDCDVCGEDRDAVLEIGTQEEVVFICADCLDAGRKMLKEAS